ncbi:MAG TPA: lysylphosphatidylglycerol synthase transmembrane domain-containing protein [Tepidisphaeraceae bacterium]|jgi:hypothetical protein|nr:lysylphosphatidylglycerol synthase transmembrane domain-containing protein [Tepidisphaeraceae bacterium]
MKSRAVKGLRFTVRWGIAIFGVYVIFFGLRWGNRVIVKGITWRDHALVLNAQNRPEEVEVRAHDGDKYIVADERTGAVRNVGADSLVSEPDQKTVTVRDANGQLRQADLLGLDLTGNVNRQAEVVRLLISGPGGRGVWIRPTDAEGYKLKVPHPVVEVGLHSMLSQANPWLIALALALFPMTYIVTTIRWHALMEALDIQITRRRTFVLNMVGAFYNTFMPGSTGGDVIKAIYASRQTTYKTRAIICVLIDRVLGMVTLIIMGGVVAGLRWIMTWTTPDPATRACRNVALMCLAICLAMALGLLVLFNERLRRGLGVEWILRRLPKQELIRKAMDTMEIYRTQPGLILWSLVVTLPVHATVVVSAMLCGMAFGLKLTPGYYFVVVPVVVLVGSIPVSPQGAGVMEFFAVLLLARQGATLGQAFALTMSIRMLQVVWNLTGGVFVLKGGFHTPTEAERDELEDNAVVAPLSTS